MYGPHSSKVEKHTYTSGPARISESASIEHAAHSRLLYSSTSFGLPNIPEYNAIHDIDDQ